MAFASGKKEEQDLTDPDIPDPKTTALRQPRLRQKKETASMLETTKKSNQRITNKGKIIIVTHLLTNLVILMTGLVLTRTCGHTL